MEEKLDLILREIAELKKRFDFWERCLCPENINRTATRRGDVYICDACHRIAEWANGPNIRT